MFRGHDKGRSLWASWRRCLATSGLGPSGSQLSFTDRSGRGLMTDSREGPQGPEQTSSQHIPKPLATPCPKEILQRIFGTSQAFRSFDETRPMVTGLTVPLKVREYYRRGYQCFEREDWELAVLFYTRALHLNSQMVDFYALRAEAYIQLCDFSSAAQNLRRACSLQPENTKFLERLTLVLYLQGQCLFEQCAFLDALNIFSHASELQPEKPCFRYRCMACLLALKRHSDCLLLVTKEVKQGTTNADVYLLRARLYNFFQKPNLCYQDLHSALLLDPKHPQAKALLQMMVDQAEKSHRDAKILAVQGKLQHAVQCINSAIGNNPLDPSLFLFRGTIRRRLQEFDAAVQDLLKALDMMTEQQEHMVQQAQRQLLLAYNDFAVHCYMQGAYQESVLLLNKALRDEQQEKGLYINRGDCFFQLGHLTFAEADYLQALALSPKDEGANLRMGLLQEKMGFCEQKSRQFQKAENHFSIAIQHNPQRAQYYLHRARSRLLTQNIFGARQDVATALLLDPKQPKLFPLMANLFSGMSVEEVLSSQVAHLARLQLDQVVESRLQDSASQGIMGQLRKRELERQKARTLQLSWKQEQSSLEASEELDSAPQTLHPDDDLGPKEVKPQPTPSEARSLSDSYPDQTSSGSILDCRTLLTTSETETSTTGQEYRSTSASAAISSDSSLSKTQSSELGINREDLSLSHHSRKPTAARGQSQKPSKTEASRGLRQKPSKTEASRGPRQRLRKTKVAHGQSRGPCKGEATWGQSWGLIRSSNKTKTFSDSSWSPSNTKATQGQESQQDQGSPEHQPRLQQDHVTQGLSQNLSPDTIL